MKTVKQVAADLGVSRQAVYRKLSALPSGILSTDNKGVQRINADGEAILRNMLSVNLSAEQSADCPPDKVVDTIITMLKRDNEVLHKELEIKNQQIAALNSALAAAQQSAQAAQVLHAGTMQKQLTDGGADQPEPDAPAKRFFAWIFKKKLY